MKKREDNPTVTINAKFNDLYDLWDHLATLVMKLDEVQEDLTELTAAAYSLCRKHEKDPATKEDTASSDSMVNKLNKELEESNDEEADDDDAEALAIALLKAVFQALSESFDE